MIYLWLYLRFFLIGLCAFGGGLATIPFLEELSETTGWFTLDELADMIAISESTPGAIGINMSTYVGYIAVMGEYNNIGLAILGGVVGTLGLVSPSIIVILIICQFLKKFRNNKFVNWAFYGLRAASIGLIGAAAFSILKLSIIHLDESVVIFKELNFNNGASHFFDVLASGLNTLIDFKCLALAFLLGFLIKKYNKHPLVYIILAGFIGIIFQF